MNRFYAFIFVIVCALPVFSQYSVYGSEGNLYGQVAAETRDGGFLLLSSESCYSPNVVFHDGCTYALFLVKTDARGDTLWSNQIESLNYVNIRVFENEDESFTLIGRYRQTFGCSGIIRIMNVSSTGTLTNTFDYTENCQLDLGDVFQTEDGNYLVAVNYGPELISVNPTVRRGEGQLLRMDRNGNVLRKIIYTNIVPTGGVGVFENAEGEIAVCFIDDEGDFNLQYYTEQFNLISTHTDTTFINDCFERSFPRTYFHSFSNGNIAASCYNKRLEDRHTAIAFFDEELNLLNDSTYTLVSPTNIIEYDDNRLLVASTSKEPEGNIRLTYLDFQGNEVNSLYITHPQKQQPTKLLKTSIGEIAVIGSVNCCDLDTVYGQSKAFLQLVDDNERVSISGTVFWDENENGQLDDNEIGLKNISTRIEPEASTYYTTQNGKFSYSVNNGIYTLTSSPLQYWEISTTPTMYNIDSDGTASVEHRNFGYTPLIDTVIIEPSVFSAPTRCGNRVIFWIENLNTGTQRANGEIHVQVDSITTVNVEPLPINATSQNGIWEFLT